MRYDYCIIHVAGKALLTADTHSRAPLKKESSESTDLQESVEQFISTVVESLPASSNWLENICLARSEDPILSQVMKFCQEGWPVKHAIKGMLKHYWCIRSELSLHNQLLLWGNRLVIPTGLQHDILCRIHQGHQGIVKCHLRASVSVWWPGISQQISIMIQNCRECCQDFQCRSEPMIPSTLPDRPWGKIWTDLFEFKGTTYLLLVDYYYSRYIEIAKLSATITKSVVSTMKPIFARYGIPNMVISNNSPQYASQEFTDFATSYDFQHIMSSPYHPQGNGEAEQAVKTIKSLNCDPNVALLSYWSTPLSWYWLSPAQLLMGRQIRSTLPAPEESLVPKWPNLKEFQKIDESFKQKQEKF